MFNWLRIFRRPFLKIIALVFIIVVILAGIVENLLLPVPIFAFHSIFDRNHPQELPSRASYLDYSIQDLETLLVYLIKNDYWFLSIQEYYDYWLTKSKAIPAEYQKLKPVMLTFDDGYKNIDVYLLPLLQKLRQIYNKPIKVVLFINPRMMSIDKQKAIKYLKCEDLKRGTELGFYDVQSHGYSHSDLTRTLAKELEYELLESQQALQECLTGSSESEIVARHLAYPYNKVNKIVEEVASQYYLSGYLSSSRSRDFLIVTNPYQIPRIGVSKKDSPQRLIQLAKRY